MVSSYSMLPMMLLHRNQRFYLMLFNNETKKRKNLLMNLTPNKILSECMGLFLSLYLTRITCNSACISMQISNSIQRIYKIGKKSWHQNWKEWTPANAPKWSVAGRGFCSWFCKSLSDNEYNFIYVCPRPAKLLEKRIVHRAWWVNR